MIEPDDLTQLHEEFPAWQFGTVWGERGQWPGARRLWASRDGILLTAWTAPELRQAIEAEGR